MMKLYRIAHLSPSDGRINILRVLRYFFLLWPHLLLFFTPSSSCSRSSACVAC